MNRLPLKLLINNPVLNNLKSTRLLLLITMSNSCILFLSLGSIFSIWKNYKSLKSFHEQLFHQLKIKEFPSFPKKGLNTIIKQDKVNYMIKELNKYFAKLCQNPTVFFIIIHYMQQICNSIPFKRCIDDLLLPPHVRLNDDSVPIKSLFLSQSFLRTEPNEFTPTEDKIESISPFSPYFNDNDSVTSTTTDPPLSLPKSPAPFEVAPIQYETSLNRNDSLCMSVIYLFYYSSHKETEQFE